MAMHLDEVKEVVGSGRSVLFGGRVINKKLESPLPTAVELAGDDIVRNQYQIDLEKKKAELEKEIASLEDAKKKSAAKKAASPEKKEDK